jgi:hypothetical protein
MPMLVSLAGQPGRMARGCFLATVAVVVSLFPPLRCGAADPPALTAEEARTLVAKRGGPLLLDEVASLDVDAAKILAAHGAGIALDALKALPLPTATALAMHGRQQPAAEAGDPAILIGRLRTMLVESHADGDLMRDMIDAFAPPNPGSRTSAWLSLAGLDELAPETALALAIHAGPLALDGVRSLSVESARALAVHTGELSLGGLEQLPADVVRALADHRGPVAIPDPLRPATRLPDAAATARPPAPDKAEEPPATTTEGNRPDPVASGPNR